MRPPPAAAPARADPPAEPVIDITNEGEVRRWAEKLSVSVEALHDAIRQVGNRPQQIGEYLLRLRTDDHRPLP